MLADDLQLDIAAVLDDPDFGRKVRLTGKTTGAYDEATGAVAAAATPPHCDTRGLILSYRDRVIDGALIKAGDRKCILKALGLIEPPISGQPDVPMVPRIGHTLTTFTLANANVVEDVYTLVEPLKTYELGGGTFAYTLNLRKGAPA